MAGALLHLESRRGERDLFAETTTPPAAVAEVHSHSSRCAGARLTASHGARVVCSTTTHESFSGTRPAEADQRPRLPRSFASAWAYEFDLEGVGRELGPLPSTCPGPSEMHVEPQRASILLQAPQALDRCPTDGPFHRCPSSPRAPTVRADCEVTHQPVIERHKLTLARRHPPTRRHRPWGLAGASASGLGPRPSGRDARLERRYGRGRAGLLNVRAESAIHPRLRSLLGSSRL